MRAVRRCGSWADRSVSGVFDKAYSAAYLVALSFIHVSPFPLGGDTQPYVLIFTLPLVLKSFISGWLPKVVAWLIAPAAVSVVLAVGWSSNLYFGMRGAAVGIGFLVIFIATAEAVRILGVAGQFYKVLLCIWFIYLLIGCLQLFGFEFFQHIIESRTTSDRGVPSLTPEPSLYGLYGLLAMAAVLASDVGPAKLRIFMLLALFQVLVLAASAIAVAVLLVAAGAYALLRGKVTVLLMMLLLTAVALIAISSAAGESSRLLRLADVVMDRGVVGLFSSDASGNQRLAHIVVPVVASVRDFFAPHGFGYFSAELEVAGDFFFYAGAENKIMSGWGAPVYELGLAGLAYPFIFVSLAFRALRGERDQKKRDRIVLSSLLVAVAMVQAVNILNPFFLIYLSVLLVRGCDRQRFSGRYPVLAPERPYS